MNRNSPRKQAQCRLIPGYAVRVRVRFRIRWWTVVVSGGGPVCGVARDSRWSALFRVFWVLLLVLMSALAVEISQHSHYVCDVCTLCIGVFVCVCVLAQCRYCGGSRLDGSRRSVQGQCTLQSLALNSTTVSTKNKNNYF